MADGYIGLFRNKTIPDSPNSLVLNEIGDKVQITWSVDSSEDITEYEVWSSVGDQNNYGILATIAKNEFEGDSTITVVDETYDAITTVYYKVYAKYITNYSTELTGNITLSYSVPDPSGLQVTPTLKSITLNWINPSDRLLKSIKVTHDHNATEASLAEANAVEVYNGKASSFTYDVPSGEMEHFHEFWIASITK